MSDLLAKLSAQQALLAKQKEALSSTDNNQFDAERDESIAGSVPLTPATDDFINTPTTEASVDEKTVRLDPAEMLRLKKELDAAKDKIARQEQELSQTRTTKQNLEQGPGKVDTIEHTIGNLQDSFNASNRTFGAHRGSFGPQDDTRADVSNTPSAGVHNRTQNIWSMTGNGFNNGVSAPLGQQYQVNSNIWAQGPGRTWMNRPMAPALAPLMVPPQQMPHRAYSGPTSPVSAGSGRFSTEMNQVPGANGMRRSNTQNNRAGSLYAPARTHCWDIYGTGNDGSSVLSSSPPSSYQPMGMFQAPLAYQPRPIGTPLSPTAPEFTAGGGSVGPWNSAVSWSLLSSGQS